MQNQALFFPPAWSPFIVGLIIIITIIVVNIIVEHITHQRHAAREQKTLADLAQISENQTSVITVPPHGEKSKLYTTAKLLNKVSNVLIYISFSSGASSPFSSQDNLVLASEDSERPSPWLRCWILQSCRLHKFLFSFSCSTLSNVGPRRVRFSSLGK